MTQLLLPILALVAFAATPTDVRSQDPDNPGAGRTLNKQEEIERAKLRALQKEGGDLEGELEGKGDADGGEHIKRVPDLGTVARARVSTVPSRLGPGQSGEVRIVMMFRGENVIEGSSHFAATFEAVQGPLSLGPAQLDPASPGRLVELFAGQPVYENTAMFRIPITVDPAAKHSRYPVRFTIEGDVTSGKTGVAMGRHELLAAGAVEVGEPLPTPGIRAANASVRGDVVPTPSEASAVRQPTAGSTTPKQPSTGSTATEGVGEGVLSDPTPAESDSSEPMVEGTTLPGAEDRGPPMAILAAGGAVLVVLLLLLLGRRR